MVRRPRDGYDVTDLNTLPVLLPIPSLNCHVIASGQNDTCSGVNGETSDVVRMSLEGRHFLMGVIVEDAKLEIV